MTNRYKMAGKPQPIDTALGPLFDMTVDERAEAIVNAVFPPDCRSNRATALRRALKKTISKAEALAVAKYSTKVCVE